MSAVNRAFGRRNLGRSPRRLGASRTGQMGNWTTSIVGKMMAEMERRLVSDRSLDLYTNDAMAHGILESMTAEAVGIGLTPQFSPDIDALGLSPEWRAQWKRDGFRLFKQWNRDPRCFADAQGRLTFYGLESLAYFQWRVDGIGVFQVVHRERPGAPVPISLLPIDPVRLGSPSGARGDVYDGVEIDEYGMPEAVHVRKPSGNGYDRLSVWDEKTGLPRILLVCDVRNISEYRQDSILGSMIPELRNNRDFVDAALVRSLLANMFLAVVQSPANRNALGDEWEDRIKEFEQGMFLRALPGEDVKLLDTNAPGANYSKQFEAIMQRLGMATSRGAENVRREYKNSYSASRMNDIKAGVLTAAEQQLVMQARFMDPCLAWMLYAGVANGRMQAKSVKHFTENIFSYTEAVWLPQPQRELDPLKSANANKVARSIGERLLGDVCAERGEDMQDYVRRAAEERRIIRDAEEAHGVSLGELYPPAGGGGAAAPVNGQDEDGEEPESEDEGDDDSDA